jgi:hypothetical protein
MAWGTAGVASFGAGVAVTVQHQTEDRHGDLVTAAEVVVAPCGIDYTSSAETGVRPTDQVSQLATLYAPAGADIRASDRVVTPDGVRWSVVGNVAGFASPFSGWAPGLTVQLQRVDG